MLAPRGPLTLNRFASFAQILRRVFARGVGARYRRAWQMEKADTNRDGRIQFDEFLAVVGDATKHHDDDLKVRTAQSAGVGAHADGGAAGDVQAL